MSDQESKLETMKVLMGNIIGSYYGLNKAEIVDRSVRLETERCSIMEVFKELGATDLDLCEAHEEYWQRVATSLDPRMSFKVSRSLKWGDTCCKFVCQI